VKNGEKPVISAGKPSGTKLVCGEAKNVVISMKSFRSDTFTFPGRNAVRVSTGKTQLSGISVISFRSSQRPIGNFKTEPSSTVVFTLSPSWSEGRSGISDQSISRNERFKSVCVTTA
jgi:hypothetical protein